MGYAMVSHPESEHTARINGGGGGSGSSSGKGGARPLDQREELSVCPQALNLIKAGYSVTVWNRSLDKCDALANAGAQVRIGSLIEGAGGTVWQEGVLTGSNAWEPHTCLMRVWAPFRACNSLGDVLAML
jgi:hypothetical protein